MIIFRFIKTCHVSLASVCLIYIFHLVHIFIIRILIHILVVSSSSGSIIIFIIIIFSYPLTSSLLSLLLCDVYRHKRNRHHWFHIGFLIMLLFSLTQQVFLLCKSVGESHTAQWGMGAWGWAKIIFVKFPPVKYEATNLRYYLSLTSTSNLL